MKRQGVRRAHTRAGRAEKQRARTRRGAGVMGRTFLIFRTRTCLRRVQKKKKKYVSRKKNFFCFIFYNLPKLFQRVIRSFIISSENCADNRSNKNMNPAAVSVDHRVFSIQSCALRFHYICII